MKRYKELRKKQKEFRRGLGHSVVAVSSATPGVATSNAVSVESDHGNGEGGDSSTKEDKTVANGTKKVRKYSSYKMEFYKNNNFMTSCGILCMV